MSIPVPVSISTLVERMRNDLPSASVEFEHVKENRWRVTATSRRVLMWIECSAHSRGRLQWQRSQLHIDGRQESRVSYPELVDLFADPDGRDKPKPEPVETGIREAPEIIQASGRALANSPLGKKHGVLVYQAGRRWTLLLDSGRVQLGMHFTTGLIEPDRPLQDPQTTLDQDPVTLVVDGEDMSAQINGRLDKALALAASHASAPSDPSINGPAPAAVNTSVQVRRQAVIRV